ncbi:hypothetical protein [Edaphovirga cremea]|uniref:hypothetical protein n=1 Tax=Edaphovirga cremea TaxID=2267246 RepID=UPI00398A454E
MILSINSLRLMIFYPKAHYAAAERSFQTTPRGGQDQLAQRVTKKGKKYGDEDRYIGILAEINRGKQ